MPDAPIDRPADTFSHVANIVQSAADSTTRRDTLASS
jgi:hypothetical protein